MIAVGLIGPIAGGKSVVLETLARCGAAIIKADDISRELLAPGSEHLDAVIAKPVQLLFVVLAGLPRFPTGVFAQVIAALGR